MIGPASCLMPHAPGNMCPDTAHLCAWRLAHRVRVGPAETRIDDTIYSRQLT